MTIVDQKSVADTIAEWTVTNFGIGQPASALPRDESLVELGFLDSYAVVELVEFLEKNWNIAILNEEITREKMGSLNKMATLILQKRVAARRAGARKRPIPFDRSTRTKHTRESTRDRRGRLCRQPPGRRASGARRHGGRVRPPFTREVPNRRRAGTPRRNRVRHFRRRGGRAGGARVRGDLSLCGDGRR